MQVVCNGYKNCNFKLTCEHSKLHESVIECLIKNDRACDECQCQSNNVLKYVRYKKLEKLKS